jgi:hypothetical protein
LRPTTSTPSKKQRQSFVAPLPRPSGGGLHRPSTSGGQHPLPGINQVPAAASINQVPAVFISFSLKMQNNAGYLFNFSTQEQAESDECCNGFLFTQFA